MSSIKMGAVVLKRMPNTILTEVRGDGDYIKFATFRKEVYQNLSAISTTYSAPKYGHLGLGMTDTRYFVRSGVNYFVLPDSGIYDVTIGATVSHVTISKSKAEHKKAVESIIKNQLKEAIPPFLIIKIKDEITGLNNINIIDIFDHVQQRRGKINNNLIDEKNARFIETFDATLGMAAYIRRVEECQQLYEDSGEGWSDIQLF